MLEDRAPDVRVTKPATDRSVTRLEEVDIEAQAEDDYGVDRLDLVYTVKGGAEKVVPLDIPRASTNVTGHHTLFLEDLDVQPGDFVSYYVRARDLTRGTRPNEARSDIFFLEVKPYEQEFALAQSQGNMPGGNQSGIDDLVAAQKESRRRHLEAGSPGASRQRRQVGAGHQGGVARGVRAQDTRRAGLELVPRRGDARSQAARAASARARRPDPFRHCRRNRRSRRN